MSSALEEHVSTSLRTLFTTIPPPRVPITSSDLLRLLISRSLIPDAPVHLRLTDLRPFETFLEEFSRSWEWGSVNIARNKNGGMCVLGVRVVKVGRRKRKREEDEDGAGKDETSGGARSSLAISTKSPTHLSAELQQIYALLQRGTAKGKLLAERFRSPKDNFDPICEWITKDECVKHNVSIEESSSSSSSPSKPLHCSKVHFRPLIRPHTDPSLGHCSYLNTCYSEPTYALSPFVPHVPRPPGAVSLPSGLGAGGRGKEKAPCRYLHFEVDWDGSEEEARKAERERERWGGGRKVGVGVGPDGKESRGLLPPQWINCDVRRFDYSVLGKFHVIMADPPWDIHMNLPYGTMTDDEMRAMPIPGLQDEGLLFLWVTGRAMEVGRECLRHWGYVRVDEVVWLKTNQLQRVIRTGRTGHWLNHTKEHMLVGLKASTDSNGNFVTKWPSWVNRGVDVDVIVSEVRETSRKPEEVYGMIERMCPGGRKIEIFGRKHNTRPGWLTLGNQLGPDQIHEPDMVDRIKSKYGTVSKGTVKWGEEELPFFAIASQE